MNHNLTPFGDRHRFLRHVHRLLPEVRSLKKPVAFLLTTLSVILGMASCSGMLEPQHADSRYLKGYIFRACIDNDYRESCVEDFGAADYDFSSSPRTLPEACLAFLAECTADEYWEGSYEQCRKAILAEADNCINWWHRDNEIKKIFRQDPDAAKSALANTVNQFFAYVENLAQGEVTMINWVYNIHAQADTYTGYLVEYEVGHGFYVLLDLVEYDNEDRYRWEFLYTGNSLTELHECYE